MQLLQWKHYPLRFLEQLPTVSVDELEKMPHDEKVKMALDRSAKEEGVTTSAYVRSLLIDALVSMS